MDNCLFCKIISGTIPATKRYEDDLVFAFDDIHPKAPVHILIIPKIHIANINNIDDSKISLAGHMIYVAKNLARKNNIQDSGYRLVFNTNQNAGQEVSHLHLHLIGGSRLSSMA